MTRFAISQGVPMSKGSVVVTGIGRGDLQNGGLGDDIAENPAMLRFLHANNQREPYRHDESINK
jgi:hypothetical protein